VDVFSIFPLVGSAAGGTPLLVEGAGFSGGGEVSVAFNDVPAANVIVLNDRELSCLTPAGEGGAIVSVRVTSSKGTDSLPGAFRYGGGGSEDTLNLELSGEPTVSFDGAIGTTTVVVDYLVRDSEGMLLDDSEFDVTMFVNDEQLGAGGRFGESVLDSDAQELDLSVLVLMVLDASYSLEQFDPPQFNNMLKAAEDLVDTGENIWRDRGGEFDWNVVWFDELISRPDPAYMSSFRISSIPEPEPWKLHQALFRDQQRARVFVLTLLARHRRRATRSPRRRRLHRRARQPERLRQP
jgi:hypothetical protein